MSDDLISIVASTTGAAFERNLSTPFFDRARRRPGATAVVFENRELTYADLLAQADALIDVLKARGLRPGDRLVYLGWNHPMLLVGLLATARMAGIFVPLNPRSASAECLFILKDSEASAILAGAEFLPLVEGIRKDLGQVVFLSFGARASGWIDADMGALCSTTAVSRHAAPTTQPDDVAVLLYTSGTTGKPKGVMLSHDNVWASSLNLMLLIQPTRGSTLLGMAPMFHVAALALAIATLATGGRIVALPAFRPEAVFEAIRKWRVTWTFGVPTMLQVLQSSPEFASADLGGMLVLAAGAPVPVPLLESWGAAGVRIVQGYGQTEATGGSTLLDADFAQQKIGSAGLPFPLTELRLCDVTSGEPIFDADRQGQIWIRGRNITQGYWRLEDETRQLFDAQGWLATGDIGRYDRDGYLYIVDRLKDLIISGGVNIYPAEVENVLARHPNVAAVAVIGVPDAHWGESVLAAIVSRNGQPIPLDEVQAYTRDALASYKSPRRVEMIEALPLNASGKVLKRTLRERFSSTTVAGTSR